MITLLGKVRGDTVLLWMSVRGSGGKVASTQDTDPMFLDRAMIEALLPHAIGLVEVVASSRAKSEGLQTRGYLPGEEAAALALPGPRFHAETAEALSEVILPALSL